MANLERRKRISHLLISISCYTFCPGPSSFCESVCTVRAAVEVSSAHVADRLGQTNIKPLPPSGNELRQRLHAIRQRNRVWAGILLRQLLQPSSDQLPCPVTAQRVPRLSRALPCPAARSATAGLDGIVLGCILGGCDGVGKGRKMVCLANRKRLVSLFGQRCRS
jgi:hypothetical protein